MQKRSKRYKESEKAVDREKGYKLNEAVALIKSMPPLKFDGSVDLSFYLNVDPKKPEQMVRGTVILPHGTGKKVRVAVFAKGEAEKQAKEAGADIVGAEDLIEKVAAGKVEFDCAIATPEMMKELSKLGKILGPRGLMPSPKTGTVTNDVTKAISELKKGKVEYRVDKQSGIHLSVGKISFDENKLYDNAFKVIDAIVSSKPATVKGTFIKSAFISASMNPGLRLTL
ncbi:MAG: 50S ribosomal protein L1 [Candidatus Omnitrophica bacterium]|nr:50S ribosomal protein L1 [Candidatus Omnitrophota bacterium]